MTASEPSFQSRRFQRRGGALSRSARSDQGEGSLQARHAHLVLGGIVIVAPHLLGGVYASSTLFLAVSANVVLAVTLWITRQTAAHRKAEVEPMAVLLSLMLGVSALHALPLPAAMTAQLAPQALAHATDTAIGLGFSKPTLVPFSLDPGGTHERVLFGIAVLAAFCVARLETRRRSRLTLLTAVGASAVLIALSDLLHRAFAASQVYGIYEPQSVSHVGPLLNTNNLAGFLALGFPVCLGLAVEATGGRRFTWLLGAGIVAATNLLAGSRGGTVALFGAASLFGTVYLLSDPTRLSGGAHGHHEQRAPIDTSRRPIIAVTLAVLSLALAGTLASLAADDFIDTDYQNLTKLEVYRAEWEMLMRDPLSAVLGVGRGAFSVGFSPVHLWFARALHAESLPLQYAIEFGIPIAVLLIGGAMLRVWSAFWKWRSGAQLGGLVGVVAITLHNLLDFSLELSGVALPAAVCLAASLPRTGGPYHKLLVPYEIRRLSIAGCVASSLLIALCAHSAVSTDTLVAQHRLAQLSQAGDSRAFWTLMRKVARAHPAEPALALIAAGQRLKEGHRDAPLWINRTLALAPSWGAPHVLAAHWLVSRGQRKQALAELRLAAERDAPQTLRELCAWVDQTPTATTVFEIAPAEGEARMGVLDAGARCLADAPSQAEQVDAAVLREQPTHLGARLRSAQRDLAARRWTAVIERARAIQAEAPTLAEPYQLEADALISLGKPQDAIQQLLRALPNTDDRRALLVHLSLAETAAGNAIGMRDAIEQLRMSTAGDTHQLAQTAAQLAKCEMLLGNDARALKALREAYSLTPRPAFLAGAAKLAGRLGQTEFALQAWESLCSQQPANKTYCDARNALRAERQAL